MSKSPQTTPLDAPIKKCLVGGMKRNHEIYEAVEGPVSSIKKRLSVLADRGEIKREGKGKYTLPEAPAAVQDAPAGAENSREASDNIETINKMLNVYDLLLDDIVATVSSELATKTTIEEKIDLIKSLRWVAATIDQLMKRWYLVHRGYDTNTRQAVEDAKQKTVEREQHDLENAPPEKQLKVVREYDESMREILAKMPKPVQEKTMV